jgi:hypothetical protein
MSPVPFSRPPRYLTEATQADPDLYREGRSGKSPSSPKWVLPDFDERPYRDYHSMGRGQFDGRVKSV